MFHKGDWVYDKIGRLGFITGVHTETKQITARFIRSSFGMEITSTAIKYMNEIKLAPISEPDEEEKEFLIDLALRTKDREWFEQIMRMEVEESV